jgi:hypothetical protein
MAIINPLEEYMQNMISRHKLSEESTDSEYQNALLQSQAQEAEALSGIDSQPFSMAAREYNLDPAQWVGREAEARQRMKQAVSANFTQSRARTADNQTQGKKEYTQNLLNTLTRLQSINQQGLSEVEKFAPKDVSLRSQLVYDPAAGKVTQVAKNVPDEEMVRSQEIADYIGVPPAIVARQRAKEQMDRTDYEWKQAQRQSTVQKNQAIMLRQLRGDQREEYKAQWSRKMQQADAANKFSGYSKQMVDQVVADPDTPPDMKVSAMMGDAIRRGIVHARQEKDKAKQGRILDAISTSILQNNQDYRTQAAAGHVDPEIFNMAKDAALEQMRALEIEPHTYNADDYMDDFSPDVLRETLSLDQLRENSMEQFLKGISDAGNARRAQETDAQQQELKRKQAEKAALLKQQQQGSWGY